jgi:hypothetical protein
MIGAILFIVASGAGIDPQCVEDSLTMIKEIDGARRNKNGFDKSQTTNWVSLVGRARMSNPQRL